MTHEKQIEIEDIKNKKAIPAKVLIWVFLSLPILAFLLYYIMRLF